jgi:asparagine synthase (glutamine-hydrolysing)
MCAIAGIFDFSANTRWEKGLSVLKGMLNALAHRGPDGEGAWYDCRSGIFMGHRRLAIVDLSSAGAQPMKSQSGRYTIVFNGEIYNHKCLRDELDKNHETQWYGHSDTEVILALINYKGIEFAIDKAEGMFAVAIWDEVHHTLHLVRDRFGEKPLYYAQTGSCIVFGSEISALKSTGIIPLAIDNEAVGDLLQYGFIQQPRSIYSAIKQLEPGSHLWCSAGGKISIKKYVLKQKSIKINNLETRSIVSEVESILTEVVQSQLSADVPVGILLSGGIDSSLIAAISKSLIGDKVKTFTMGFDDKRFDESEYAASFSNRINLQHTIFKSNSDEILNLVNKLNSVYSEPFADPSAIPTSLLMRAVRNQVSVVLGGDGADELFGGYSRYTKTLREFNIQTAIPKNCRSLLHKTLSLFINRWSNNLSTLSLCSEQYTSICKGLALLEAEGMSQYASLRSSIWQDPNDVLAVPIDNKPMLYNFKHNNYTESEVIDQMAQSDMANYLPNDILVKIDRASMAFGLEVRSPFLDNRLVQYVDRLPPYVKFKLGQPKWILKELLKKHSANSTLTHPKRGFTAPLAIWLRGPLRSWAEDLIMSDSDIYGNIFKKNVVKKYWSEHLQANVDWSRRLWPILVFSHWHRQEVRNHSGD